MKDITIPTVEQLKKLEIIHEYGKRAEPTDFCRTQESFEDGKGEEYYWTKTPSNNSRDELLVVEDWMRICCTSPIYSYGVRPIIPLSSINKKVKNVEEIEYGEYPQNMVDERLEKKLENLYQQNKLVKTKKSYTVIKNEKKEKYQEYMYKSNKYVRVYNWELYKEINWIEVEPITWLVDEKEKIAISKNILNKIVYSYRSSNNYKKSNIKKFLEKYFRKEIIPDTYKIDNIKELLTEMYEEEKITTRELDIIEENLKKKFKRKEKLNKNINMENIDNLIDIIDMLYPNEKEKTKVITKK